jgi:1,4-dihydroxy-2-naphthoyl-CoA hydrolase
MQDMDRLTDLDARMLPFAKLLGMTFTAAEPDRVAAELVVRDDLCTRPAVLHGGAIMAFADTLGAAGTILTGARRPWSGRRGSRRSRGGSSHS